MSEVIQNQETEQASQPAGNAPNAWDVLESLIGTVEGPEDWAEQHDHYLYGTPKHE